MGILSNTVEGRDAAVAWLSSRHLVGIVTGRGDCGDLRWFNATEPTVFNLDGHSALSYAKRQITADNCAYILYLEDDRIKVCVLQSMRVLLRSSGITTSFMTGAVMGNYTNRNTLILVDLADNYGAEVRHHRNPPERSNRQSLFRTSDSGLLSANLGRNGVKGVDGEYHEGTMFDLTWAQTLMTDQCLPLAVFKRHTEFSSTASNSGVFAAWLNNGRGIAKATFPVFAFEYSMGECNLLSTDIVPSAVDALMEENNNWDCVFVNLLVHFTGRTSNLKKLYVNTGLIMEMSTTPLDTTFNEYTTVRNRNTVLRLHGSRWDGCGTPTDEDSLPCLLSESLGASSGSDTRAVTFLNRNNELLLLSVGRTLIAPKLLDENANILIDAIGRVRNRAWFMLLRNNSIGDVLLGQRTTVFVKTREGLLYMPNIEMNGDGKIVLSRDEHAHMVLVGQRAEEEFGSLNALIEERGVVLMREMKMENMVSHLSDRMRTQAKELGDAELARIKRALDVKKGSDISSLMGGATSGSIWGGVDESFVFELFKSLGPPDWGCSIIDGHIVWYKDKLRWENRNSVGGASSIQSQEYAFIRYETPFNQLITLSRTARGWCVMTKFWGVGRHPNVELSGGEEHQSLCHGAVSHSVIAEDKNGKNLTEDYNRRNGTFVLTEALRVVNYAAQIMEASVVVGDSGQGHNHPNLSRIDVNSLMPLFKWNVFDIEGAPEEYREKMKKAYRAVGRPFVFAMLPSLAKDVQNCLSSKWFWKPPKITKPMTGAEEERPSTLGEVAQGFRERTDRPTNTRGLGALFG